MLFLRTLLYYKYTQLFYCNLVYYALAPLNKCTLLYKKIFLWFGVHKLHSFINIWSYCYSREYTSCFHPFHATWSRKIFYKFFFNFLKVVQNHLKHEKNQTNLIFSLYPRIRIRMKIFVRIRIRKKMRIRNPASNW